MRRLYSIFPFISILILVFTYQPVFGQASIVDQSWEGIIKTPGGPLAMQLKITQQKNKRTGLLSVPSLGVNKVTIEKIDISGDSLFFPLTHKILTGNPVNFKGKLKSKPDEIKGIIERKNAGFNRDALTYPVKLAKAKSSRAQRLLKNVPTGCQAHQSPEDVKIVTSDITHFWQAFDKAAPEFNGQVFKKLYFNRASKGLRDFILLRMESPARFAQKIRSHAEFYASIRNSTQKIDSLKTQFRSALRKLEKIYPEASYPDIYFLVGRFNTGGTESHCGLLIAAEQYSKTSDTPVGELSSWEKQVLEPVQILPLIVIHELVHFEQRQPTPKTLLGMAIHEGSADFIAHLATDQRIERPAYKWGPKHEKKLWDQFKKQMDNKDMGKWFFKKPKDQPADLGYWIGYKIVQSYYNHMNNKKLAVKNIINIHNYKNFLKESEYQGNSK